MDSVDLEVLRSSASWLAAGHKVTLVTVTKTWGSSPRPAGAMLALRDDGVVAGSVSGGCIEDDLVYRARHRTLVATTPEVLTYGVSAEEAQRFGLPCGGTIQVVVEPVNQAADVAELVEFLEGRQLVAREVEMRSGVTRLRAAQPGETLQFDGERLITVHGPMFRLLIIGAGQLSRFLAEIANGLDYQVTVCDPRAEYSETFAVPSVTLVRTMPDDTVIEMKPDARTAVVALTHDPKLDDMALMEALKTEAFYVGAIGSRANNRKRRERLREFDVSEAEVARLHGPIGLYIGSRTPPEIAISIMAEMTACKNGVALSDELRIENAKNNSASACAAA